MTDLTPRPMTDLHLEERSDDELAAIAREVHELQVSREKAREAEGKRKVIALATEYGLKVSFEPVRKRGRPRKTGSS